MAVVIDRKHPLFFAEVTGIDLAAPLDDGAVSTLEDALADHGVLHFPGQTLTTAQQIAFSRRFGNLETDYNRKDLDGVAAVAPEIVRVSNLDTQGNLLPPDATYSKHSSASCIFHSDSSFKYVPSKCSLLYAIQVSSNGANTEFADMRAAYDDLTVAEKERIDGLIVEHSIIYSRSQVGFTDFPEAYRQKVPPVPQLLVRTHSRSQRKSLYLGSHASHIVGRPIDEGRALLKELTDHATQPKYVHAHKWAPGDLVMWDNRSMLHRRAPGKIAGPPQPRELYRTTVQDIGNTVEIAKNLAHAH